MIQWNGFIAWEPDQFGFHHMIVWLVEWIMNATDNERRSWIHIIAAAIRDEISCYPCVKDQIDLYRRGMCVPMATPDSPAARALLSVWEPLRLTFFEDGISARRNALTIEMGMNLLKEMQKHFVEFNLSELLLGVKYDENEWGGSRR